MQKTTQVMALAIAGIMVMCQYQPSVAFKLKNPIQLNTTEKTESIQSGPSSSADQPVQSSATASSSPIQYKNEKFGYNVELTGKWNKMSGDPNSNNAMFFDQQGNKGSFQVNANWMADNFPVQSSLNAMEQSYKDRVKHGELTKYYRKDVTVKDPKGKNISVFQGYVTVESPKDPDPDIQRMQWIGYAKGNYYNFTWSSNPESFNAYMPEFEQTLNKIQFAQ
jgi:hypothetical protein